MEGKEGLWQRKGGCAKMGKANQKVKISCPSYINPFDPLAI